MSDPCEKRLDRHFKQQLKEFDSSFKKIACKSDQIIINYWMHIYKSAPKEQKLSRNCLTLLMYGHLNEFGYLQYPFTDMRNCGKDLNEVLDAYKGLPYLRRVSFAHKGILFGSDTTISLDKSPTAIFNDYVLTNRVEQNSNRSSKQNTSLTYMVPSKDPSLSTMNSANQTATYTVMPKGTYNNSFNTFNSHECYTHFEVCHCITARSSVYSVSKSNYSTSSCTYHRYKDRYDIPCNGSNPTSSRIGSLTEDSFRPRESLQKKESFNTTFNTILESCRNMGVPLTQYEPNMEVPLTQYEPNMDVSLTQHEANLNRSLREAIKTLNTFESTFSSTLESCRNMGIALSNKKTNLRFRPKGFPGFRIDAYRTVFHLTYLRGLFSSHYQVYIIPLIKTKQSWVYYRRTLLRNYTSLQLLYMLLKRKKLNDKMRFLLDHLRINYMKTVEIVCSDVETYQLKRRQLKWMLDGMESKYLHMGKVVILKALRSL